MFTSVLLNCLVHIWTIWTILRNCSLFNPTSSIFLAKSPTCYGFMSFSISMWHSLLEARVKTHLNEETHNTRYSAWHLIFFRPLSNKMSIMIGFPKPGFLKLCLSVRHDYQLLHASKTRWSNQSGNEWMRIVKHSCSLNVLLIVLSD